MPVICQCASCKAKYQVGDQYAGRTIKCPKCSAAVVVPTAAPPAGPSGAASNISPPGGASRASTSVSSKVEPPTARTVTRAEQRPAESASPAASSPPASVTMKTVKAVPPPPGESAADEQDASQPPPVDDGLGFLADEPVVRQRRTGSKSAAGSKGETAPRPGPPPVEEQSPAEDESADDLSVIASLAARSSKGVSLHAQRPKKKKRGLPAWMIPTIAALGAVAVVVIAAIVYLAANSKNKGSATIASATATAAKGSGKTGKPEKKVPVLAIDWPENQRGGAALFVNDEKRDVLPTGPIEIQIPPSKEQYQFRLERRGFQPKKFARVSQEDDQGYTVTEWEPLVPKGIDWEQDFEAAKQSATSEHKHVLILFDASDAKASSFASSRFREAVAMRKEFRERADKEYVCVYVDNPKNSEARDQVKDADRNRKLTAAFGVTVFPTVVVTDPKGRDPKGRPFGVLEGYKINGIMAFLELMDKWEGDSKTLRELLAKTDSGAGSSDLAGKALDFLQMNKLDRFYDAIVKDLTARIGAAGGRPVTKELAEMWMQHFELAARNPDEAKKVIDGFDRWKQARVFKDHEMGAALHLAAAWILARLDLRKEAVAKCKEGLAYEPHNPRVRGMLEMFNQALSGEPGKAVEIPMGSGTGFCIAQGNYVLTNHHVIDRAKIIKVRLNGGRTMYSAKLVGDNEEGDMALLKIELPEGKDLRPVPLVAKSIKTGQGVCALGFPEIGSNSTTPTVTQGIASSIPDSDDESGYIVTDCRVNPGNSGGPLCNLNGSIAGMVSAKSHISARTDSYGLVIPAGRLRKFLAEHLPAESRALPPESDGAADLQLADLNDKISPSVVYIENVQEMRAQQQGE